MLKYRLISGLVLVAFVLALFWADGVIGSIQLSGTAQRIFCGRVLMPSGLLLTIGACVLIPFAAGELTTIFAANGVHTPRWLVALAAVASAVTLWAIPIGLDAPTGVAIIASVLVACFLAAPLWQASHVRIEGVVASAGATMFAVAYLGLMSGFYLEMRRWHPAWVVLAVVLVTKCGDIGAFFTGRAIGRHKLIPWLSPGKTWEGLAGGIALATLAAWGFAMVSQHTDLAVMWRTVDGHAVRHVLRYSPAWSALGGAVLAIVGHAGDLTMSLFKRDSGLKDSGSIIPGMGGILDVLDSPLLVAPFAYWMLQLALGVDVR